MALPAFDPFEALGLPRDASEQAIKQRYHQLSRKYHPNRHPGSDESKAALSEHFHQVHRAWKILKDGNSRRRHAELLNLLELQDDMLTQFIDLLDVQSEEGEKQGEQTSQLEEHFSSDADEDLPNVGLHRRQTLRGSRHFGNRRGSIDAATPTTPTKKSLKWALSLVKGSGAKKEAQDKDQEVDYFTLRRRKLEKLRRKELEAFLDYRDAMVAKFDAEEEVQKQQETYMGAKWKREYFERAPRATTERFRSFQHAMSAVAAFENVTRDRNVSNSDTMFSPITEPSEPLQYLNPDRSISRHHKTAHHHRPAHRRGFSSDISGDQTDSGEDESGDVHVPRKISPPGYYHAPPMRNGRPVTFANFRRPVNGQHVESSDRDTRSPGPFKLLIRKPSDLGMIAEAQDPSADTPSDSSRSPSPYPVTGMELTKFVMLPASGPAEVFGVPPERRARSLSPAGHSRHASSHESEHRRPVPYECKFEIKHMTPAEHTHIPISHVHLLAKHEKANILGIESETDLKPALLLQRLSELDSYTASKFAVKPNMEEKFNFRLIYGNREVTSRQHQSFIALSYRRKLHVERHSTHYTLPLEPEMFQAVWDERQSDTEGVWIDQICIDQESDTERTISMSAMDMVYRSARLIVVALDDIEDLTPAEGDLLQKHMDEYAGMTHVPPRQRFRRKDPPYLQANPGLYTIVRKMLRSSWFKRAWCRHEMRLAKHHIFLVPCTRHGHDGGRVVLRFNGKCLAHLLDLCIEVPIETDVELVVPALYAFFRDRATMAENDTHMRLHHGNFSTVVAEVFAMEAGGDPRIPLEQRFSDARKDKISIILNTMECGLALHESVRDPSDPRYKISSDNQCFHDLVLLALAARDPGALCSVGAPLAISEHASSWLFAATVADSGLNNFKTLERLPEDARIAICTTGPEHFIQLDLRFMSQGLRQEMPKNIQTTPEGIQKPRPGPQKPTQDMLDLARHFLSVCSERKWGRNRKRYLMHERRDKLLFGSIGEIYIETLACIFHCGPDWMSDVCRRYSMSRWKVDLQGAWQLMVVLMNTNGRWPAQVWDEPAAAFIADFVNFIVIRGLPRRQISKPEQWRPVWVNTGITGGKVLTFCPVVDDFVVPAIPTILLNANYVHLARLWLLKPRVLLEHIGHADLVSQTYDWTLLGKTVLFSDELALGMATHGGDFKHQQRIFGRRKEASYGISGVRERKHL